MQAVLTPDPFLELYFFRTLAGARGSATASLAHGSVDSPGKTHHSTPLHCIVTSSHAWCGSGVVHHGWNINSNLGVMAVHCELSRDQGKH
jgi:hypothetical protein